MGKCTPTPPPEGRTARYSNSPLELPADDGPVSARTIRLVQSSWGKVFPIPDAAATLFYDRLFEMEPSLRPMFKQDMREQKRKLMQTLSVAVDGLNNLPTRAGRARSAANLIHR